MIWIILFIIVLAISVFLARRSMKDYQELPHLIAKYGVFLVKNPSALNLQFFSELHSLGKIDHLIVSFERLSKGEDDALVLYAPKFFPEKFPDLGLFELEDYLSGDEKNIGYQEKQVGVDKSFSWVIDPKNNQKKPLSTVSNFLDQIKLAPNQRFFWQIVLSPQKDMNKFQVTIRVVVSDDDPLIRVELAKEIAQIIENATGFSKSIKNSSQLAVFKAFRERTLVPKEITPFVLESSEILALLG